VFTIDANLDVEAKWAGAPLPAAVATRISYYAALTSVLAPADAQVRVYAPADVDATRIELPVTMRSGRLGRAADLEWGARSQRAANDRRLAMRIAAEHGIGVPGAHAITSVDELAMDGPWVAKGLWTSAGRDRCHGTGPLASDQRMRIIRLLERFGALVVEPWLPRILDVGVCAMVGDEVRVLAPHGQLTDARGTFLGIDLAPPALTVDERARLAAFVTAAGARLAAIGYRGPIAVDAFLFGPERALAVCEINARYSFGWVARGLAERFGTTRLGFSEAPPGARVLIAPASDGITAWIA
jgi:hypothetical protein